MAQRASSRAVKTFLDSIIEMIAACGKSRGKKNKICETDRSSVALISQIGVREYLMCTKTVA